MIRFLLSVFFILSLFVQAISQCNCDPLPQPGTNETVVYVNNLNELQTSIANASGQTTIFLNSGVYPVSSSSFVNVYNPNITIRSTAGHRDSVVFQGQGMAASGLGHGVYVSAHNVTIADLTVRDVQNHGFFVTPGVDSCFFQNVRGLDCGEQIFKASGDTSSLPKYNGIIQCSAFEYTTTLDDGDDGWYTNGIDLLNCHNWIIRDNLIRNIKHNPGLTSTLAGPAILCWHGSTNTIIERNLIIECDFGISFGNAGQGGISHSGGIIKNNFVLGYSTSDFGIGLVYAPGAIVINNTVYSPGGWPYSIEARFAETNNCQIINNYCDEPIWDNRDGASCILTTNSINAQSSDFVNVQEGDLHLVSDNLNASNAGTSSINRIQDIDCEFVGMSPDLGADEFTPLISVISQDKDDYEVQIFQVFNHQKLLIENAGNSIVKIIDGAGQIIFTSKVCGNSYEIDMANQTTGIYFIRVESEKNIICKKILLAK